MKKISIILVMLFWCNVGFADIKKIYNSDIDYSVYNLIVDRYEEYTKSVENDDFCDGAIVPSANLFTDKLNCVYERIKYHLKKNKINYEILVDLTHNWYSALYSNARRADSLMVKGYDPRNEYGKALGKLSEKFKREFQEELTKKALEENARYLSEKDPEPKIDDNEILAASSGSGFFISKAGYIVTNYHVTENCNSVKVIFKDTEAEAKILAVDKRNDLAIIKANINPDKIYAVSNKDVSLMQDVIVAGFPLGKDISSAIKTHKGSVTALAGFGDNYSNFETDATINQGNSGGPILDHKGNIVGVAVATWVEEGVQSIHFGIKSSTLKTFASANEITFLPPSNREMSKEKLAQLVTDATVFLECWMTGAKIKKLIAQKSNRKALYSKFK